MFWKNRLRCHFSLSSHSSLWWVKQKKKKKVLLLLKHCFPLLLILLLPFSLLKSAFSLSFWHPFLFSVCQYSRETRNHRVGRGLWSPYASLALQLPIEAVICGQLFKLQVDLTMSKRHSIYFAALISKKLRRIIYRIYVMNFHDILLRF